MKKGKTIINISGKSCTGKSSLTRELSSRFDEVYIISYDRIKRQLIGYDRNKHSSLIKEMTFDFFEIVCSKGFQVIIDGSFFGEEAYNKYLDVAQKYGYRFVAVHLETPLDDLLPRFRERIERCRAKDIKISVMDEGLFIKNQSIDYFTHADARIFNTTKLKSDEIADQVMELIK